MKRGRRTATISKFIKQNQKSYYSLDKISLLKARYGSAKFKLEWPKCFFVSHRHKSCISPVLVPKNFQIISNVTKCITSNGMVHDVINSCIFL